MAGLFWYQINHLKKAYNLHYPSLPTARIQKKLPLFAQFESENTLYHKWIVGETLAPLSSLSASTTIAAYRPVIGDAAFRYNQEKRASQDRDTYEKAFFHFGSN